MTMRVSAYLARWGVVSRDQSGQRVRAMPGSFDRWLKTGPTLPMVLNHGFDLDPTRRDERPAALGKAFGRWHTFEEDEVGLLAHGDLDETGFLGARVAKELRSGDLVACSFHTRPGYARAAGDGVLDMVDVEPTEGGPTYEPADPGALVVAIDGVTVRSAVAVPVGADVELRMPDLDELDGLDLHDLAGVLTDFLGDLEQLTGRQISTDEIADRERRVRHNAREQVRRAERCASELARTRRDAEIAYSHWRGRNRRPEDWGTYRALVAEAEQHEAALRELCYFDDEIVRELRGRYKVPPADNLIRRMTGR